MDPITLSIGAAAVASAASTAFAGVQQSSQATAQGNADKYNAQVLTQQGQAESNSAASNMGMSIRRSAGELGTQAAAIGQANIGTGGSGQAVEQQSAKSARMDALNIWYGGELEKHQADAAAQEQLYNAKIESDNSKNALYGAGTKLLMGAATSYAGAKYGGGMSLFNQNSMDGIL